MPICPGCERTVSYERLDVHERYCKDIWSGDRPDTRSAEQLERRLAALEARVDRRLRDFEEDLDRRSSVVDAARGSGREAGRRK